MSVLPEDGFLAGRLWCGCGAVQSGARIAPQTGQSARFFSEMRRFSPCSPSKSSIRPRSVSPAPVRCFTASSAIMLPSTPGKGADHPCLGAGRHGAGRGTGGKDALIARAAARGIVEADLPFPLGDRRGDQRLARSHGGAVDQIARVEIVRPVEDQVILGEQVCRDLGRQPPGIGAAPRRTGSARASPRRQTRPWPCRCGASAWMIWRCRLEASTASSSITPMRPTPAAARYSSAGAPRPPAPMTSTARVLQRALPRPADLAQQDVARVAVKLGWA